MVVILVNVFLIVMVLLVVIFNVLSVNWYGLLVGLGLLILFLVII